MDLSTSIEKLPLNTEPDGTIRVGQTRVTLETVVSAFQNGSTCEEIVFQFPALDLADVYAVIGFYLKNRPAVEKYLAQQAADATHAQEQIQRQFAPAGIRQRLLKRRDASKSATS